MAQEDKETLKDLCNDLYDFIQQKNSLLLKDLSARLPYKVRLKIGEHSDYTLHGMVPNKKQPIVVSLIENEIEYKIEVSVEIVKPYLRSMSSMTDEEAKEYLDMLNDIDKSGLMNQNFITKVVDWLDKNLFDHRGLIPKGLALEAPEGMYKN